MPDYTDDYYGSSGLMGGRPGSAITGIAGGLISGITGLIQKGKAKRLLSKLQYPIQNIPSEVLENQAQAKINANVGLPSAQYQQAMQNIQRQQNAAIRSASDRRGALGLVSGIQRGSNDALLGLDVANARARLQNQKTLMDVNNQLAQWKQKQFDWNVKNKYQRDYNYGMGLLGAGNQNFVSGIDKFSSGIIGGLAGGL